MAPLDIRTKSGKLLQRIIELIPFNHEVIKTNLFNVEYMPPENIDELVQEWFWTNLPTEDDLIILLGSIVQSIFKEWNKNPNFKCLNIIKIAHPSSIWSNEKKERYISKCLHEIDKF